MNLRKISRLILICLLAITVSMPVYGKTIKEVQTDKTELEAKKHRAQAKAEKLEAKKVSLAEEIAKVDQELGELDIKITDLQKDIKKLKRKLKGTRLRLKNAKISESKQYDSMKLRIKYMYENGETAFLDILFQAKSFSDLLNRSEYIAKISEYDHNMLVRLENTRKEIVETEADLQDQLGQMTDLNNQLAKQQAKLVERSKEQQGKMQEYTTMISQTEDSIQKYEDDIQKQEDLIRDLERANREKAEREKAEREKAEREKANKEKPEPDNNNNETPSIGGGRLGWPVPSSRTVTSPYGYRIHPISGVRKLHDGMDIAGPIGSSIVAAQSGTVLLSAYSSTAGNWIIIDHGNGLVTVYMHNTSNLVAAGARVSKGQHIANMGSTGTSTGSHLHFCVRVNGTYVDPMTYLK